jgi:hypothetical protein
MENTVKKLERMESLAVRASDKGFCSEAPGGAAGWNPVNCCGAAIGRAGRPSLRRLILGSRTVNLSMLKAIDHRSLHKPKYSGLIMGGDLS